MTPRQTVLSVSSAVFIRHVFAQSKGNGPSSVLSGEESVESSGISAVLELNWGQGHYRLSSLFAQPPGHLFLSRSLLSSSQSLSGESTLRSQVWPTCANPIPPEIDQET